MAGFSEWVGHEVLIKINAFSAAIEATVKGIDDHGLLVEASELTLQAVQGRRDAGHGGPTPVDFKDTIFFVPFSAIQWVMRNQRA